MKYGIFVFLAALALTTGCATDIQGKSLYPYTYALGERTDWECLSNDPSTKENILTVENVLTIER